MAQIIEILGELSKALGVPVLTPEYEIALTLLDCPGLTADQLIERSSLSRAGFFNTVDRLKTWGFLVSHTALTDRRCKIYSLSDHTHDLLIERFREYQMTYTRFTQGDGQNNIFAKREFPTSRKVELDYFSCEFQIIFYLNLVPNLPNNYLGKLVDSSSTKFSICLRSLLTKKIVRFTVDEKDGRRKLYDISSEVRKIMESLHTAVFDWLAAITSQSNRGKFHDLGALPLAPAKEVSWQAMGQREKRGSALEGVPILGSIPRP